MYGHFPTEPTYEYYNDGNMDIASLHHFPTEPTYVYLYPARRLSDLLLHHRPDFTKSSLIYAPLQQQHARSYSTNSSSIRGVTCPLPVWRENLSGNAEPVASRNKYNRWNTSPRHLRHDLTALLATEQVGCSHS